MAANNYTIFFQKKLDIESIITYNCIRVMAEHNKHITTNQISGGPQAHAIDSLSVSFNSSLDTNLLGIINLIIINIISLVIILG
jgi:hypothetical protein